jgi:hypothetical protein
MPDKQGKYGKLIQKARSSDLENAEERIDLGNSSSGKPETQTVKPEPVEQVLTPHHIAEKPENQKNNDLVSQKAGPKKGEEPLTKAKSEMVNLCVKVPEAWRRHWAGQSKLRGKTMTEIMIDALQREFGLPD